MCTDVFSQLMELTATAGGKKKGKGKKKKVILHEYNKIIVTLSLFRKNENNIAAIMIKTLLLQINDKLYVSCII